VTFIAAGARSLDREEIGLGQRWLACRQDLPSSVTAGALPNGCRHIWT
jgi:hypothetical protein